MKKFIWKLEDIVIKRDTKKTTAKPPRWMENTVVEMLTAEGELVTIAESKGYNPNRAKDGKFTFGNGSSDDSETVPALSSDPTEEEILAVHSAYELDKANQSFSNSGGDPILKRIQEGRGFNGKPKVVSPDKFEDALDLDTPELHRGFGDKAHMDQYLKGKHHPGLGLFGNGTYASVDRAIAKSYTTDNSIMNFTFDGKAKVVTYNNLMKEIRSLHKRADGMTGQSGFALRNILSDPGRFAAMRGYEVMHVEGAFNDSQFVIFNRGKVIVNGGQ